MNRAFPPRRNAEPSPSANTLTHTDADMSTLSSSRSISIADHHKRRRQRVSVGARAQTADVHGGRGDGHGFDGARRLAPEGAFDSHAAAYGNWDSPSRHCRSHGASDHGCYAAEGHIGSRLRGPRRLPSRRTARRHHSDPCMDLEGQQTSHFRESSRRAATVGRRDQASPREEGASRNPDSGSSSRGASPPLHLQLRGTPQECSWKATASIVSSTDSDSASSASSRNSPTWSLHERPEHEAIERGIHDLSRLVADLVARALSSVVGLCLTLASSLVRIAALVVGDVLGLLGDAGLWQGRQRLRGKGKDGDLMPSPSPARGPRGEARVDDATECHPQCLGAWRSSRSFDEGNAVKFCPSVTFGPCDRWQ